MSYCRTAIKYAQTMVPHTAMHGDTFVNTVSKQSTLPKQHNCHTAGSDKTPLLTSTTCITPTCTMHAAHICCTWNTGNPDEPGSSCSCHASCSQECPSTNAYDIPCHTCAAMKFWPCPHGTKMPDPGDVGTIDLDRPWTLLL